MKRFLPLVTLLAAPARADVLPGLDRSDPRVAVAHYQPGVPIRVEVTLGQSLTVLLPSGDTINALGDELRGDWQIKVDEDRADSFVLTPLRPVEDFQASVMTRTHTYLFTLSSDPPANQPIFLRVLAEGSQAQPVHTEPAIASTKTEKVWKLSGNRELLPSSIRDDGNKIYLEWNPEQAIPAVFALDRLKREEMVNGFMRGSVFTIDRVYERLVFRLDRVAAEARRRKVHQP